MSDQDFLDFLSLLIRTKSSPLIRSRPSPLRADSWEYTCQPFGVPEREVSMVGQLPGAHFKITLKVVGHPKVDGFDGFKQLAIGKGN